MTFATAGKCQSALFFPNKITSIFQTIVLKTGKNTEGIKPKIRYVCDTSKLFIYYTTRDGEDKSNTPMSRDAKRYNQNL